MLLTSKAEAARATDLLVGAGIVLPDGRSTSPLDGPSGQIVWKQYRDQTDEYGIRHVFYRQFLKPAGQIATTLPEKYQTDAIPLPDTAIGLHFEKDGTLGFVFGHQVTVAQAGNFPKLNTSQAAAYAALAAVIRSGDYVPFDPSILDAAARTKWEDSAELSLRWHAPSSSLKLVWRIVVSAADGNGIGRIPAIDAESGDLLEYYAVALNAFPCAPDQTAPVNGTVCPQWSFCSYPWILHSVPSTWLNQAQPPSYFEAHWPRTYPYNPRIQVFKGSTNLGCDFDTSSRYYLERLLLPKAWNNTPYFGDSYSVTIEREAGDVMFNSCKALETSLQYGWYGYQGPRDVALANPARIVIDKSDQFACNSYYYFIDEVGPPSAVTDMIVIGKRGIRTGGWDCTGNPQELSACADIVSHEWGHGILKYASGFDLGYLWYPTAKGQLAEGFADMFAHIAKHAHPETTAHVDWTLFDDCELTYEQRRADLYLSEHTTPRARDLCYFRTQPSYGVACPYTLGPGGVPGNFVADNPYAGHMLSVALYLLAHGGFNPANGAPYIHVPPLGDDKASRIMFRTFVFYLTSTAVWEDIPAAAVRSAFDAYKNCPSSNAQADQDATAAALGAIGYSYSGRYTCN